MSFKEAKELRKSGKLAEALEMALQDLQKEPDNIWCKRSVAWVYYDYLKANKEEENFDAFYGYLLKIKELELPEAELMLFDQCAWQVGLMIFSLCKSELENSKQKSSGFLPSKELLNRTNKLFEVIKGFHLTKPSDGYSFMFKAFHKVFKESDMYKEFADWWNYENFRPEDFLKETLPSGKSVISIAEQAYIAYCKILLSGNYDYKGIYYKEPIKEDIDAFIPRIDELIEKYPNLLYLPYYKAKLLIASGDTGDILSAFIPFAIKKRNEFWVWDVMADIFPNEDIRKTACLCRALTCSTSDDFLVNIRQKLAALLIQGKQYVEAKTEIENIVATYHSNNWSVKQGVIQWQNQNWYKETTSQTNNHRFYKSLVDVAEEILLADIPERTVVVEFVNSDKKILNFVESKSSKGFFYYGDYLKIVKIGDVLKVRFKENPDGEHFRLLSAKLSDEEPDNEVVKDFSDTLKVISDINIGFAGDVFIDSRIIAKKNLQPNQSVKGRAIISYNKKKQEWGWKAIEIKTH